MTQADAAVVRTRVVNAPIERLFAVVAELRSTAPRRRSGEVDDAVRGPAVAGSYGRA
jgi:hypothetical protein